MAHTARGESSSSSDPRYSTPNWKYDVFLSFTGKDTRLKFLDHLDKAFERSGIKTFKDDKDLERGKVIKEDLLQAIEDSLCAVVVISENYAKSTWCLEELQKILKASEILDRRVFPIFYDVDPADVRHQRKRFQEAMDEHEDRFREDNVKVHTWRSALCEIANLSGWDTRGRQEADLIEEIVREVWAYIIPKLPSHVDNLVGIESRARDIMSLLEIGVDDRRFVGIWGMGGVGKTTLARVVFEKLSHKFEVCCFLVNVRETFEKEGHVVSLQRKLLSPLKIKGMEISDDYEGMKMITKLLCSKKVLLVIDDVDHQKQLNNLAKSPYWFGKGSRIIFTTRDKHLLTSFEVDEQRIYEMKTMEGDESLQLFSNKAFNKGHPPDEAYWKLSKSVVEQAAGLPLALEVLGYFLRGREKDKWIGALDKLKKSYIDKDIYPVLKISYDGLDEQQQRS
ncbi:TMV resistance protein N-like [Neltuma alba]|uniref:TMV resistance protein N-like n=1 Tax=Neltuma alba TaxID=207710 RepID=UPI0010A4EC13|nr:TMV resistance protein N-like [Prosopis alba]